jgi:hypothetical protein
VKIFVAGAPVRERNLPDQSASAVGRAETVHEQVQKLQQRRLLTIVGSGGSNTTIAFTLAGARQPCMACRLDPKAMPTLADGASRIDSPFADV